MSSTIVAALDEGILHVLESFGPTRDREGYQREAQDPE